MNYDWEDEINAPKIARSVTDLPDGMVIIGLAVENTQTGEAALIRCDADKGVLVADSFKDVLGDAMEIYSEAVDGIYEGSKPEVIQ